MAKTLRDEIRHAISKHDPCKCSEVGNHWSTIDTILQAFTAAVERAKPIPDKYCGDDDCLPVALDEYHQNLLNEITGTDTEERGTRTYEETIETIKVIEKKLCECLCHHSQLVQLDDGALIRQSMCSCHVSGGIISCSHCTTTEETAGDS